MERNLLYRIILVAAVLVVSLLALVPTTLYDYRANKSKLPQWWTESALARVLPQNNLTLGLDLQGGMDLVVSVDVNEAVVNELRNRKDSIEEYFRKENIPVNKIELDPARKRILIDYPSADAMRQGETYIQKYFQDLVIVEGRDSLQPYYGMRDSAQATLLKHTIQQVRNVLARRMDQFGLKEPEIVVQGNNQIRLQLPGISDRKRIIVLIKRSAKLEFALVQALGKSRVAMDAENKGAAPAGMTLAAWTDPNDDTNKLECYFPDSVGVKAGPVPANRRLVLGVEKTGAENRDSCYLLMEDQVISGKELKDARPGYDPEQFQASVVNFEWNMSAAQRFSKLTGDHVGEPLAIVLEGQVVSAPVIRSKIFNRGQISGGFTAEEATDLSNVLRSGALDVNVKIEEERSVGASLGADSIHKGEVALVWGSVTVILFMMVYYSLGGIIANVALALNVVLILAILSLFGATLTLPGLAGIVLTIGMAVDANVLIFERVREELRTGKTPMASIDAGYAKAFWTIFDSNITTLIAALVLLQWGTGPIKGFAITLAIGITSSMFTAIVVTRMIYDLLFLIQKKHTISIGIKLAPAASGGRSGKG
ncbi:MAG TPA: protein translocase subunit SecD [bacterium]|nr:protein translocase subunit SecD [bacterium]